LQTQFNGLAAISQSLSHTYKYNQFVACNKRTLMAINLKQSIW